MPYIRLATAFGCPDILRQPAVTVLAAFAADGPALIATWAAFVLAALAFLPLSMAHALTTPRIQTLPALIVAAALARALAALTQAHPGPHLGPTPQARCHRCPPPPHRAASTPFAIPVEEGKTHFWCACAQSKNQPLCDGSHKSGPFNPVKFTADAINSAFLCGCKQTMYAPFCDGTHKTS